MRPLTLIGIGGFGKWVITVFRASLLDRYGSESNFPTEVKWLSFDLTGQERPEIQVSRFERGTEKQEMLNFTNISPEFMQFEGDFLHEIRKIRTEDSSRNPLITAFMEKEDAEQYILDANTRGAPAGERRHTSRITFVLSTEKIKNKLAGVLMDKSLVFTVNSLAGGTGSGTFIDFLLLLQNLIKRKNLSCQLINIFLLPKGFVKAKEGEDLNPLKANCYAAFREFRRMDCQGGNTRISYSLTDVELKNVRKTIDILGNVTYLLDGYKVAGVEGDSVKYFYGIVPSIVDYIHNFALAYTQEEENKDKQRRTGGKVSDTSFDQVLSHVNTNRKQAESYPENAAIYGAFGNFKLIFDIESIKKEFSQKIAIDIIGQFLAPAYLSGSAAQSAVQDFLLNEATRFDKEIVYQLKDPRQQWSFATKESLLAKLQQTGTGFSGFPEFNFKTLRLEGKVRDVKAAIDNYEVRKLGQEDDTYDPRLRTSSFHAALNFYRHKYTREFEERLKKKVLETLHKDLGQDSYGQGALTSALNFLETLQGWYEVFQSKFSEAKICCEQAEGELKEIDAKVETFYKDNMNKGRGLTYDPRKSYRDMRQLQNRRKLRDLLQQAVFNAPGTGIAQVNLDYIKFLAQQVRNWIYTFGDQGGLKRTKSAKDALVSVRGEKARNVVCHHYLTSSEDEIEKRMYWLIRNQKEMEQVRKYAGQDSRALIEKEISSKLPSPSWADLLRSFSWDFNLPRDGRLPYPNHLEGELVCTVASGLPDWPSPDRWADEEAILTWNYQLTENFLRLGQLSELELTASDVLMWLRRGPASVIADLELKSSPMLDYDLSKHNDLGNFRVFDKESRFVLAGDFAAPGPLLKKWNDTFCDICNNKGYTMVMDPSNEISLSQVVHNLAAKAIPGLMGTREEYLRRLEGKIPPPLHVFRGEKAAYVYEKAISRRFKTEFDELDPSVITALEDELLVKNFVFGQIFGHLKEEEKLDSAGNRTKVLKMEDLELPVAPLAAILKLFFPPEGESVKYAYAIQELDQAVRRERMERVKKDKSGYEALLKAARGKLESGIKQTSLSKGESDLKKTFVIILGSELESIS